MRDESDRERGLYNKYTVNRKDGGSFAGRKHEKCSYFVLDLVHDEFAPEALMAYANACEALARDLREEAMKAHARALATS